MTTPLRHRTETLRNPRPPFYCVRMIFSRRLALWAVVLLLGCDLYAVNYRMGASTTWAENISHSSAPSDWRDGWRHDLTLSGSVARQWDTGLFTDLSLDAGVEHVPDFRRADGFTFGPTLQVRQKFGLGAYAPMLILETGLHAQQDRLDASDGWLASASLSLTKRLTSALRVSVVGDWQQRYARSSIFDTRHHRFFATVAWDIKPWLQLSHGNGRLWGDIDANASPGVWSRAISGALGPSIFDYYTTTSWGETELYGPGWVTYRVTSRVSFWWLEFSPALGRNTSLPLRYESVFSVNKIGIKYRQDLWTLQVLHRF